MFSLYSSLTRQKEFFNPLNKNKVLIYVCGITPYDTTHIGHAFTYVFFDVLIRYLKFKKFVVNYVQNITDIDDDILKKSKEEGKNWKQLGDYWTKRFLEDTKNLNLLPPDHYIKATDFIDRMISIIKILTEKKFAYEKNGNVYFGINKFQDYGQLSKFNREQMIPISKERGGDPNDPLKKNPLDFMLWQKSKKDEPFWQSPWGKGRPGWHIECSAMIDRFLGKQIDIHGGGKDLIFPHHESEIAQSETYTGKSPFVKYWMHTAMVLCNGEKMSKSLGNLVMVSDLLKKYSANSIKWYLISHHYRTPWEFQEEELITAQKNVDFVRKLFSSFSAKNLKINLVDVKDKFIEHMDDDINTPQAINYIETLIQALSKQKKYNKTDILKITKLKKYLDILGFDFQ